ncbi:M3 family metallopeptidase [uncultured Duncaniella sp.]|jgi:peptidyl-dipeptidase Dcp|uniref:M3 family metallopeptidase n=1 Tax=uncultured Duncaniella sp. TaxID=2768039 RepID=UPI000AFFA5C8|nr:M3 family metallopeptidase [uncultured Duncaniella sp.]
MKPIIMGICMAATATALSFSSCGKHERQNPFMKPYDTVYEIPPFDEITIEDYVPAFDAGIAEAKASIDSITANPEAPTFANTILALDNISPTLERVMSVLMSLTEAHSSPELQTVSEELLPRYTAFSDEMMMNPALFQRVKYLYDRRDSLGLAHDETRALEETYKGFARNGALLDADKQARLKDVNSRLANLYIKFNKNLLEATNAFEIVVDNKEDLAGIPQSTVDNAAEEAKSRGKEGKWVFTLHAPSRLPVLQYADNRSIREKMWKGYTENAQSGTTDNRPVINDIVKARAEKAAILGYKDYASYMTADVMAKTPEAAEELLLSIWTPAKDKVKEEVAEMQALSNSLGNDFKIAPWDYYYFAEKVRRQKYALDENAIRPYFAVDSVAKGIFSLANKLYGITFEEMPDAPKYHPDVKVYDVKDPEGKHLAVFMTDYFTRASKRQGAWMEELKTSWVNPDGSVERPIVYNVGNFSKPTADAPSLLTIDEVQTMFHEFGHGLHGMLSRARLKSQSGTSVDRDFVEFPSQIHEHWAFHPELLKEYAYHYQTGELIPDSLVTKINAAAKHNMGFMTAELSGAALLDLNWGHLNPEGDIDAMEFENSVAEKLGMPEELTFRYRSPYFKHIFGDDGYASGYYTYLWAEVLDADAFELFKEKGVFDPETAAGLKTILESGSSEDPMVLFETFRGHRPTSDALLRQRGLAK